MSRRLFPNNQRGFPDSVSYRPHYPRHPDVEHGRCGCPSDEDDDVEECCYDDGVDSSDIDATYARICPQPPKAPLTSLVPNVGQSSLRRSCSDGSGRCCHDGCYNEHVQLPRRQHHTVNNAVQVHGGSGRVYPVQPYYNNKELAPVIVENGAVARQMAPVVARRPPTQYSRPQSSLSSSLTTSAIVDGCGGKCQTFENVCYFFLQLVFTMGILIGVSLCIAGLVLRKSAARNLQVLVYIGALVMFVCALLLSIQWNARSAAKRRKVALRTTANRAPIPLERLPSTARGGGAVTGGGGQRSAGATVPMMTHAHNGNNTSVLVHVPHQVMRPGESQPNQQQGPDAWWRLERT